MQNQLLFFNPINQIQMTYLLNLPLPLWAMFLPLGIAAILAYNLYRVQNICSKLKANYQAQLREAQNRLDEATKNSVSLTVALQGTNQLKEVAEKLHAAESELAKYKLAIRQADDNLNDVRLTWSAKSEKDAEIIRNLNTQAVEREALIVQLKKDLANESEILQERIKDKNAVISEKDAQITELNKQVEYLATLSDLNKMAAQHRLEWAESLQSKLELSEVAHNETKEDLIGEKYYIDAIAEAYKILYDLVKRNSRTRKQYDSVMQSIGEKRAFAMNNLTQSVLELANKNANRKVQTKTIIDDGKAETVVPDSLGTPRVFQADQSESVNDRHGKLIEQALQKGNEIIELCNEINRGIAEQAQRINEELASVVDMSQLESGDSVILRNSNSWVASNITHDASDTSILTYFVDGYWYSPIGRFMSNILPHENDIIQIIKPAKCYKSNKPCGFNCQGLCKDA
jgi:hypothetical protein